MAERRIPPIYKEGKLGCNVHVSILRHNVSQFVFIFQYDDFTVAAECCYDAAEPSDEFHCEDFLMECCHNVESEHFNGLVGKALLAAYNVVS